MLSVDFFPMSVWEMFRSKKHEADGNCLMTEARFSKQSKQDESIPGFTPVKHKTLSLQ